MTQLTRIDALELPRNCSRISEYYTLQDTRILNNEEEMKNASSEEETHRCPYSGDPWPFFYTIYCIKRMSYILNSESNLILGFNFLP